MLLNFLLVLLLSIAAASACGCFGDLFSRSRPAKQQEKDYLEALKFCKKICTSYIPVTDRGIYQVFYSYNCVGDCMARLNQTYRCPHYKPEQNQTSCQIETNATASACGCFDGLFSWFGPHPAVKLYKKAKKECTKECMELVWSNGVRLLTGIPYGFHRNDTCMKNCMERKRRDYIPLKNETRLE